MSSNCELVPHIRTIASRYQCDHCPPERVCAWACVQGAGIEEIIIGTSLALEGVPGAEGCAPQVAPDRDALWESFNT